jgi:hypothetical protein
MDVLSDSRTSDAGRSLSPLFGQVASALLSLCLSVPDVDALSPTEVGRLHRRTRHPHPDQNLPDVRLLCFAICTESQLNGSQHHFCSDSRFFAFIGCRSLTCSFRRLNLLVCLATRCYRVVIVVVVVVIFCLVGLGEMGVAFVERSSADDLVVVLATLEIGLLSFAEFVDIH